MKATAARESIYRRTASDALSRHPMRHRGFWSAPLAVLLSLLCVGSAVAVTTGPLRVLTPAPEALVTGHRLIVRISAGTGVSQLRARAAGHPLSIRRVPGKPGLLTASGAVKSLPRGRVAVTVRALYRGRRISSRLTVIIGRRSPGLLRAVALPGRASGSTRLRVRLGGRVSAFRVLVNDRRAALLRKPDQPVAPTTDARLRRAGRPLTVTKGRPARTMTIPLSADDGLRPGRNRVVVLAYRASTGRWAQAVRTVWISRNAPLVAAGQDRRILAGATVRLDGSASRPAHPRERLRYRWRIVSQPKLPRSAEPARLLEPQAVRPRLVAHRPGVYEIRLELAGGRARGAGAMPAKAASALADVMTVDAAVSAPPYGLRLSTGRPGEAGATRMTIEGVPINPDGSDDWIETPKDLIRIVTLNRATLAVESVRTELGNFTGIENALGSAYTASGYQMTIVTAAPGCCTPGKTEIAIAGTNSGFTLIGTGGHIVTSNFGIDEGAGPGALSGLLREAANADGQLLYTFTYPETVPFDTYVEGTNGSIHTEVAGRQTSGAASAEQQTIAITALSPGLEPIPSLSESYVLQGNEQDRPVLEQVLHRLQAIASGDQGGMLLLQTIGSPKAEGAVWGEIGNELASFGGTPSVWDELNGGGNYALVGVVDPGQSGAQREASTVEVSGPAEGAKAASSLKRWVGTTRGILGRGENGLPVIRARTSLPSGTTKEGKAISPDGLAILAESAPQPWPLSDPAHEAALSWISQQLGPEVEGHPIGLGNPEASENGGSCYSPSRWDVRAEYCNEVIVAQWNTTYTEQLKNLACPSSEAAFSATDCTEVVKQLKSEFGDISTVHALIQELKKPLIGSQGALAIAFVDAGERVEREVTEPAEKRQFPGSMQDMTDSLLGPAQDLEFEDAVDAGEAGATDGLSLAFGLIESVTNLMLEGAESRDGEPATSPFFVPEKAKIGVEASARLSDAINGVGGLEDLLLSDWTKLSTTAANGATIWGHNNNGLVAVEKNVERGAESWLYEAMLPTAYAQLQVTPKGGPVLAQLTALTCEAEENSGEVFRRLEWQPFKAASANGVFAPTLGVSPTGAPLTSYLWVIANAKHSQFAQVPAETLTNFIFSPVTSGGVGIQRAPFFTWSWLGNRRTLSEYIGKHRARAGLGEPEHCEGS